ncbi:MAG: aminotransferase class I/II-fold pyridoxal phosphate-dependent enzyme [Deltaproteobacteria bacterium]|nr:aminotransferase class I/II-fold pyridoxal phosphate-dependent enzyme [Deltaproteobacteria bacterium]
MPPDPSAALRARAAARSAAWRARGLERHLSGPQGVDLTSNDCLGLSKHPAVAAAAAAALQREGLGSGGSRLLGGHRPVFDALEARFAAWQGAEAALYFGSGSAANLGALGALFGPEDVIFSDALNHASLIDGLRLCGAQKVIFPHGDIEALRRGLSTAQPGPGGLCAVVVESLYSMDGDLADLHAIAAACAEHGAALLVDEAHATGLFGPTGQGLVAAAGLRGQVALSLHGAGKALGAQGGFVAGDAIFIDALLQRARSFIFSTAPPPAVAAGLLAAIDVVEADPELRARPLALADRLRAALPPEAAGGAAHIVPVHIGDPDAAMAAAAALQARGWDLRAVRPPTVPAGTSRLRVVLRAGLTEAQIDALAADLREVLPP